MATTAGPPALKRTFAQMRGADFVQPISAPGTPTPSRPPSAHSPVSRAQSPVAASCYSSSHDAVASRPCSAAFDPDASILLVGVKGVGKSTLAVLAAIAYSRNVVELDRVFVKAAGSSAGDFRSKHGFTAYQRQRTELLKRTLASHSSNAVIVASLSDVEGERSQLVRSFAETHPVIHVTRDSAGLRKHLGDESESRVIRLMQASWTHLRSCTNFDFLNTTEKPRSTTGDVDDKEPSLGQRHSRGPYLTLKSVEHDFLKLLRNIIGDHSRGASHRSAYPLSQIPVEELSHTHVVRVPVSELLCGSLDLEDAQVGADGIEIAIDDPRLTADEQISQAFAVTRRATILPIALTMDPSVNRGDPTAALRLAETCIRLGPEFVIIGLGMETKGLRQLVQCKGRTKIIGSHIWTERPRDGWLSQECNDAFSRAADLGCDVVRLVMPAESHEDCFSMHTFRQSIERERPRPKLSVYCSGPRGRSSWCFNKVLQPVRPRSSRSRGPSGEREPNLATSQSLIQARYATFLQEPMRFIIYGARVSYSMSPVMHNAAYDACGMPHVYETCSSQTLDELSQIMQARSFGGAAITQPFKASVIPMIDALSPHASAIGAVNTIIPIRELDKAADGTDTIPSELSIISQRNRRGPVKALYGDNSDWIGIRACLRRGLSPANTVRPHSTALVCGAGGMARAAIYSMLSLGVKNVFIYNRTHENAQALADHYNELLAAHTTLAGVEPGNAQVRIITSLTDPWPKGSTPPTMIVVSIPALSTDGSAPPNFTIPKQWLHSPTGGVVVELAYRPAVTPVVLQIREEAQRGWVLMDGFDMLPEQAFAQFELFTGCRAPRAVMRREAEKRYVSDLDGE